MLHFCERLNMPFEDFKRVLTEFVHSLKMVKIDYLKFAMSMKINFTSHAMTAVYKKPKSTERNVAQRPIDNFNREITLYIHFEGKKKIIHLLKIVSAKINFFSNDFRFGYN